jgi:hypothetical protein
MDTGTHSHPPGLSMSLHSDKDRAHSHQCLQCEYQLSNIIRQLVNIKFRIATINGQRSDGKKNQMKNVKYQLLNINRQSQNVKY